MRLLALAGVLGGCRWSGAAGGWPGGAGLLDGAAALSAWSHFLLDRSDRRPSQAFCSLAAMGFPAREAR
jgi:hypothetical protein